MLRRHAFLSIACAVAAFASEQSAKKPDPGSPTFYDFNLPDINGAMTSFAQYKGKVLLIVNVASHSNFTPQYAQLQKIYERYKDAGLIVLAFPSNDFGNQEPASEAAIKSFAQDTYHVTFPLFSKVGVRGDEATPLFHYLSHEANTSFKGDPHWNFTKFLVDRKGALVGRFEPEVTPEDPDFLVAVEQALTPKPSSPVPLQAQTEEKPRRRDRSRE